MMTHAAPMYGLSLSPILDAFQHIPMMPSCFIQPLPHNSLINAGLTFLGSAASSKMEGYIDLAYVAEHMSSRMTCGSLSACGFDSINLP